MTQITKNLRKKILDLAIRGKLVPQDPNDEPASALLQRIKSTQMTQMKRINADKKISDNQSNQCHLCAPFEIPESWEWCRLNDIAFLKAGFFVKAEDIKNEYQENLFPCYGGNGLRGYVETFTHDGLYSLIGRQGALCGNINLAKGKFHATEHAIVTSLYCDIDSLWMFYTLKALNLNQYSIGAAQPGLSVERINKVLIPLPPLPELNRIVSVIESAFALIDEIEANKLSLSQFIKQAKSKVLDLAIRGKLVPQDPNDEPASVLLQRMKSTQAKRINADKEISENQSNQCHLCAPFEIPESWEWVKLEDIVLSIKNGATIKQDKTATGLPITRIETISNGTVDYDRMGYANIFDISNHVSYILKENDILMSHINSPIHVGKTAIYKPREKNETIIHGMNLLCIRICEILNADFVNYIFNSQFFRDAISPYIKNAVNQASINIGNLNSIKLPLPPLPEQHRIVQKIEAIFQTLDKIQNNL